MIERLNRTVCAEAVERTEGKEDTPVEDLNGLPPDLNLNQKKTPTPSAGYRLALVFLCTSRVHRKIKVNNSIEYILHLRSGQRIIICSRDGSLRVWDLERGTQVGKEWKDKDGGVEAMALSPDGETIATGSVNGAVKLWNVDTGKVIKKWTGHIENVCSVCWSPDGRRVVSRSDDGTFRVWDVESGETIIGPIEAGGRPGRGEQVCYSPNAKMIATGGFYLKIWDANTGKLLKTFHLGSGGDGYLGWTSDGQTLFAGDTQIDTATLHEIYARSISLSPIIINERILASVSRSDKTVQLYNLEINQPIRTPLHHENYVNSATFSADGMFLVTSCRDSHIYTWDLSAIVNEADPLSDIADAQPAPKTKDAPRIPPGFFDDGLREANLRTRQSQSHGPHNHPTPASRQRALNRFFSFLRHFKPHRETEPDTQSRSHSLSWTRNLVSGILRKRDGSDIQSQEVPYTAGKPRNYHARGKPAVSSSRPLNSHTTQQPNAATQSTPPSSQQSPPTATPPTLSAAASTLGIMEAPSRPNVTIRDSGWRTRLMLWVCCTPIQNTDSQH